MNKFLILVTGILLTLQSKAQVFNGRNAQNINSNLSEVRYDERSDAPLYLEFIQGSSISASENMNSIAGILGMSSGDSWKLIRDDQDDLGYTHSRYQQYYNNIKVITGEYILHKKGKQLQSAKIGRAHV